ncbi:hypothetical protein MGYG_05124 [Nannizzia gypsea CBS 118893]|uniref:Uncharacterized protein n=1 Tax=Arthroderma gypseum (strain ATCC MYA-4604 / CBS 118893) TaxID=535722 RepID=E4UYF9_ARTGP|nr:hypothetical protein MGYG_05124 [Nannizzia gypsea CBS 118893]EFR02122.1 hypothetical protein MGYG_05124 [Nannizzia gypsea CBS 118893]
MGVPLDGGEKWVAEEEERRKKLESLNKAIEELDDSVAKPQNKAEPGEIRRHFTEAPAEEPTNTSSGEDDADQLQESLDLNEFARSHEDGAFTRHLNNWLRFHGLDPEELTHE